MNSESIITAAVGAAAAIGSFFGGRKSAESEALATARGTVEMLEAQLRIMQARDVEKEETIRLLTRRIDVLEDMVLQREDIGQMKRDIQDIKEKVCA